MSLYPFDYCGIYHRGEFIFVGGYDVAMRNPHWQKVDFGFRTRMWGKQIELEGRFRIRYLHDPPSEDETVDEDYKKFFLKNLALRFRGDSATIPRVRFLSYFLGSGSGLVNAVKEFRAASRWIDKNKYLFQDDAKGVTELWEVQE